MSAARLHGVRRALKSTPRSEASIQGIAARWGFRHLGHFVTPYRQLFGCRPSETPRPAWSGRHRPRSSPGPSRAGGHGRGVPAPSSRCAMLRHVDGPIPDSDAGARLSSTASSAVQQQPSEPKPAPSPGAGDVQRPSQRTGDELRRLTLTFLLSLLIHALLLSLTFGDEESGLPGFGFPWRERRIEAPALRVRLVPAPTAAAEPADTSIKEPMQQTASEQAIAARPTRTPPVSSAPTRGRPAEAIVPKVEATAEAAQKPDVATDTAPATAPLRTDGSDDAAPAPIPEAVVNAEERPDAATSVSPAAPSAPTPVIAIAPGASSEETVVPAPRSAGEAAQERAEPETLERAVEAPKLEIPGHEEQRQAEQLEATRVEAARREAERQEAARQAAAREEALRQEAARQEAARIEAERQQAARAEAARREAVRLAAAREEAQRQEADRQEAARVEAAQREAERQEAERQAAARLEAQRKKAEREEAARIEAARREAERQEAARQEAARQETARIREEQEEDARREARRRAMGRQLDEEAARREAASTAARSPSLPYSLSTARRVRLWGRAHPNVELIQYAEAWALKIQFNTAVETVREVAKRPHTPPVVTVAVRSDGSVESMTFEVSSGVAEIDEAIRRIVEGQRPYQPFPPALASEFDVIEIRRTWYFDTAVRLN